MPSQKTLENKIWNLISYIFHPIFIPLYSVCFLLYGNSAIFAKNTEVAKTSLLFNVLVNLVLFQLVTVFLMKQLNFIKNYTLENKKERIGPLFVYTLFTFWFWAFGLKKNPANQNSFITDAKTTGELLKNAVHYPEIAINMGLAFFVAASLSLLLNSFFKISLHMIGVGLALGLSIIGFLHIGSHYAYIIWAALLSITVFLSRKKTSNHTNQELFWGFLIGLATMLLCQQLF